MTTIPRRSPKLPFGTKDAPPSVRDAIETLEDRPCIPQKTPASSSADGYDREFCADEDYAYVYIGAAWRKAAFIEGPTSYTPALSFATPGDSAFTYTTQSGQYYRIGDLAFVVIDLVFQVTHTTASGALQVSLPVALHASAPRTPFTVQSLAGLVLGAGLVPTNGSAGAGGSVVTLNKLDQAAGTGTNILVAQVPTGAGNKTVRLSGWYRAA